MGRVVRSLSASRPRGPKLALDPTYAESPQTKREQNSVTQQLKDNEKRKEDGDERKDDEKRKENEAQKDNEKRKGISAEHRLELDMILRGAVIPPDSDRSSFVPPLIADLLAGPGARAESANSNTRDYPGRTLVLCFDGTGNKFDHKNSNVINFFSALSKGDNTRQLVYYQSGIGTYTIQQDVSRLDAAKSKALDLMFAKNLKHHVMSGYKFLMHECE